MAKLIPILVLVICAALGLTAGKFLRPPPAEPADSVSEEIDGEKPAEETEAAEQEPEGTSPDRDYVKMNNQFVVPIVTDNRVSAMVVLSLSIEAPLGKEDDVLRREPKLRDSFLRVLFTHANIGGFDGEFTSIEKLGGLKRALKEVGQRDAGADLVKDVLIVEIARQDY